MKSCSYGSVTIRERRNGTLWFTLPVALRRDCGLQPGDTVTFSQRKEGGFFLRFYRRRRTGGWCRLLPAKQRILAEHPR